MGIVLAVGSVAALAVIRAHVLLLGVQAGPLALAADALQLAAVVLYLSGVRRLARRGRRWPHSATAAFVGGLFCVWVAVGSGLAAYDQASVTLHVVQHLLLMMVAPPLIAMAKPVTLALQGSRRAHQVRILHIVHHPLFAAVTLPPLAWVLYYGTMYAYFLSPLYRYSISHELFHQATHLVFLVVGYLYWQPMVGSDPGRWRLGYPARVLSTFVGMPLEAFLAASIFVMSRPIDPINTLADTHTAGYVFLTGATLSSIFCLAVLGRRWVSKMKREAVHEDERARSLAVANRLRAEALGFTGLPEGWTVPSWQLARLEADRRRTVGSSDHLEPPP